MYSNNDHIIHSITKRCSSVFTKELWYRDEPWTDVSDFIETKLGKWVIFYILIIIVDALWFPAFRFCAMRAIVRLYISPYSIIRLYRTRLYRNSAYIEVQSAVPPDTMSIQKMIGYIETWIYQSIHHGPLNFDITGLYCITVGTILYHVRISLSSSRIGKLFIEF